MNNGTQKEDEKKEEIETTSSVREIIKIQIELLCVFVFRDVKVSGESKSSELTIDSARN